MTTKPVERDAMLLALTLARRGPAGINPQVGAVILSPGGEILAEGWHRGAGTAHAEVDALSHLSPGDAAGATAIVTLEPCNHTGRTGPCTEALLDAGIARVVFALSDPGDASGGGAERLRAAGVQVEAGVCADEARDLLSSWLTVQVLGRPHVTVKWAQSLDGRAAAADGTSQWITGAQARSDVHVRRSRADAIVVGTGTVLADDPSLTARTPDGDLYDHQPRPVIIGERETPSDAAVQQHPLSPWFFPTHDLAQVLSELRGRGVHSVFIEGGPSLASAFLSRGLVDEVLIYTAPLLLGGDRLATTNIGVDSIGDAMRVNILHTTQLGADFLVIGAPLAASPADQGDL
ncbi:diaminohydroxyphosphoribosylaminopyrimidine deaminase/5-amino-6-(5-phosphoribosylamino)uracil reductase [Microbacterium endophyticum]|uniref:Riboflavin biosynthesis protein RibD n=1 Tax=Microbacterium endophyticum TaxID=1526412 RepID=A0A7W4V2N2_9MICO|nr:bifunctional diaminohydroxyphosphoribosylaminopyrimidine deaminase/5-amino-6-(5-phosphoribosylamino)uracil reductase RibD [Microbacterium endophyticum]MBB2975690.1 diaminohydroxyphosphoribosylaminopyrimidine deaminase/5-amino-6-(5-phosphoribosylamino)uracil reductase [Microbacterium endophyticum]NIK35291.1 diaminohydroxyphosphoribosylaminopyrimidine deaminase/5-amino-6-(5-phosphoribosylamino)uracil reductase [Microbacterium endophyticum]